MEARACIPEGMPAASLWMLNPPLPPPHQSSCMHTCHISSSAQADLCSTFSCGQHCWCRSAGW